MPILGLEPHAFCFRDRRPKPVRLEETSNPRLVSECIIPDANTFDRKMREIISNQNVRKVNKEKHSIP